MIKTCATCICWRKTGHGHAPRHIFLDSGPMEVPAGPEGQCRAGAPIADFRWPLTSAGDWCRKHLSIEEAAEHAQHDDALGRLDAFLCAEQAARIAFMQTATPTQATLDALAAVHPGVIAAFPGREQPPAGAELNLGAGSHGAASPAAGADTAGAEDAPKADDTGNRPPSRSRAKRA